MLEAIEKLLILQESDRKILRLKTELSQMQPEREALSGRNSGALAALEAAKTKVKHIESRRKTLELEVDSLKQKIEKYSFQQFQTKKNEDYKMLGSEIERARVEISGLDDKQLECMEEIDEAQKEVAVAVADSKEAKNQLDKQLGELAAREQVLTKELADLEAGREPLTVGIDEAALTKYTRLLKTKGDKCLVGIEHSACGGCHMKLPAQVSIACRSGHELTTCPLCGRILFYLHGMDLVSGG
jgi:predicted  nucleic acid-binding Zn-ribbon protein